MTQADSVHSTPPTNTSAETPLGDSGKPQDSLYLPTDTTPEQLFRAIGKLRKDARDEIDRLIRFLDTTDDYVSRELEDEVDAGPCDDRELEPSLCGVEVGSGGMDGDDLEADDSDDEPSIGSGAVSESSSQADWAVRGAGCVDAEDEHDGAEPDHEDGSGAKDDDEPSLGWTIDGVAGSQSGDDRELQDHATVLPAAPRTAKGVAVQDRGYGGRKVITGMTARQIKRVKPRLDRYGLISTDSVNTRGLV